MKTPIKQLIEWANGFKEVASYHQNDYGDGMMHVLNGLDGQIQRLNQLEKQTIVDAYEHEHALVKFPEFEDGETYYNNLLT